MEAVAAGKRLGPRRRPLCRNLIPYLSERFAHFNKR